MKFISSLSHFKLKYFGKKCIVGHVFLELKVAFICGARWPPSGRKRAWHFMWRKAELFHLNEAASLTLSCFFSPSAAGAEAVSDPPITKHYFLGGIRLSRPRKVRVPASGARPGSGSHARSDGCSVSPQASSSGEGAGLQREQEEL